MGIFLDDVKLGELKGEDYPGCDLPKDDDYEVVEPTKFFTCLNEWIENGTGKNFVDDIKFEDPTTRT